MPSFFMGIIFLFIFGGIKLYFSYWLFSVYDLALWLMLQGNIRKRISACAVGFIKQGKKNAASAIMSAIFSIILAFFANSKDVKNACIFFILSKMVPCKGFDGFFIFSSTLKSFSKHINKISALSSNIIFLSGICYMVLFPYDIRILCLGIYTIKLSRNVPLEA